MDDLDLTDIVISQMSKQILKLYTRQISSYVVNARNNYMLKHSVLVVSVQMKKISKFRVSVPNNELVQFSVNASECYQTVKGFGATISDSTGINIASLSPGAQNQLLR
jgi:hypothetical protein